MTARPKTILLGGLAALWIAAAGCSKSASTPAGGTAGMGAVGAAAGSSAPGATFTMVYDMMFPMSTNGRCNACHGLPANDLANGNLFTGMDKATAYAALVGRTSTSSRCMQRPLVLANQPDMSLLFLKLTPTPPCGVRMPNGGTPFTDLQMGMIRSWIAAGAKND